MNIGIIGHGTVGKALEEIIKETLNVFIRDIKYDNTYTIEEIVKNCNIIFICISTPNREDGVFNSRLFDEVIYSLEEKSKKINKNPLVVIKSTIVPLLLRKYTNEIENLRLVVNPENLTENNALEDLKNCQFQILGGSKKDTDVVERFFKKNTILNDSVKFAHLGIIEASLIKYIRNSFLATKVSLLNEFFKIFEELGTENSWEEIMEALHLDERMGTSHYLIPGPDGKFGWGGKCFPKDIEAITKMAPQMYERLRLLENVQEINKKHRGE
jgi:nucleotide sugar dehydrogenase